MDSSSFILETQKAKRPVDLGAIANDAVNHSPYCVILELLALKLHCRYGSGSTQSTTTVAWSPSHSVLYLTSQSNSGFEGFDGIAFMQILEAISAATNPTFYAEYCFKEMRDAKPNDVKLQEEMYNVLHYTIEPNFARLRVLPNLGQHLDVLAKGVRQIAPVVLKDLFATGASVGVEATGFHGESRIVRQLYILLGGAVLSFTPNFSASSDFGRARFKELVQTWTIYFGSSQGTCKDCRDCLDEFGFQHGPARLTTDKSPNWVDPITLQSAQQSYASPHKHADRAITGNLV